MSGAGSSASLVISANRLSPWQLFFAALVVLLFAGSAFAQTDAYTIRGNATPGSNNIWSVDLTTGVETLVYTNYPGGNAATLAQRASDGMLFYSINSTNGDVYRFNPATPSIAPVRIGPLGPAAGVNVSGGFRMAFNGNTLYYMIGNTGGADSDTVYTLDQNTGQATKVATVTGTNNGGDIAFLGNTLYIVDQTKRLCTYAGLPANGAAGGCSNIAVADTNSIGIAFDAGGQLLLQTVANANLYRNTTLITALSGGNTATGDLAGANVPAPNLSITKTDGATTVYRGGPVGYTIVVTNNGTYTVTGTVVDNLPATVTGATWTCSTSAPSFCGAASGAGNINTTVTLAAGASATYTITNGTLSAAASGNLTNTATVAVPAWLTDSNPANNTATDTDTINLNANLGITKTDGLANINPGSAITYTIVVSNAGPDASNGSIFTDTVPASITGVTWTCGSPTGGATCGAASGSGNSISTTANLPSGGSVRYTVSGTLSVIASGTLSNTATVLAPASGVTDPNDPTRTGANNNSATDTTIVNPVPDLTIAKSHSGNFTQGQTNAPYTITVTNSGNASTTAATVTVTDTLPAGLTYASASPASWTCSAAGQVVTCTASAVVGAGASYPALTLNVNVAANAGASVTNNVTVSGGGQVNTTNDSASDPTTINQLPDLTITKSHAGNFTQGQTNAPYTITVTNSGTGPTTAATVTVTDTLPAGLTYASASPASWSCSAAGQVVTCTASAVIAAGASYPVLTLNVNVSSTAAASVTNNVTVAGGGEINAGNNSATDVTAINGAPDLTITKSHAGNFTQGQANASYTLTVNNIGRAASAGTVTVTDTLPAGLTFASGAPAPWACSAVGQVVTCTSNTAIAALGNSAITLLVNVAANAPASVTNNVTVSGGGQTNTTNDSASDPTTINQLPDLTITKTHVGNFTQGQTNAPYTITVTNSGNASTTNATVTVTDTLPAGLTYASASPASWTCSAAGQVVTCTTSAVVGAGASYPALTLNVNVAANAGASVTNNVTVSGGGQVNTSNDSASDPTTINQLPDLTITKSHSGNFTQGQTNAPYTLTVTNSGTGPTTNATVTVTDTLPAGLTYASAAPASWSCSAAGQVVTCTRSGVIGPGVSYPALTLNVNVSVTAPANVTNNVTVSGGGQIITTNDSASDPTTINQLADLTLTKTHSGNFTRGSNGTYTITVTNSGNSASSGTVTVTDTLPAGLTPTGWSGAAPWSCSISSQTVTCTNTNVLNAGASFPPLTITVAVAQNAASSLTNVATVSGGGQVNTANDTSSDPTTVVSSADLSLTKTVNNASPTINQNVTFTITLSNAGPTNATGMTVLDQLPAGLTFVSATPSTGSYASGTGVWTVASLASGANATLQIVATVVASGSITNTAEVTASNEPDPDSTPNNHIGSEDDQASVAISAPVPPNIGLVKSVNPAGTVLPGSDLTYTIIFSNSGGSPAQNFIITDPDPANVNPALRIFANVDFKVGSASISAPFTATIEYSNNSGATWTYTPVSGGSGAPSGYDRGVTNLRWRFTSPLSQTAPNNAGNVGFIVRVR